jgi:hypothetical protein
MWAKRNAYRILVGKSEEKTPLGKPMLRWEDNIKVDLGEIGWGGWTRFIWLKVGYQWRALVNTIMNLRVP